MRFKATVYVFPKTATVDPEQKQILDCLHRIGFESVSSIKKGKCFILESEAEDEGSARTQMIDMCKKLLANDVMETIEIVSLMSADTQAAAAIKAAAKEHEHLEDGQPEHH